MHRTRVLIVGGGLAGLVQAALLGRYGVETIIVDQVPLDRRLTAEFDGRTTAISLGSRRVLEAAGVWDAIAPYGGAITDIRIADNWAPVFLHFDHAEIGDQPFGHIFENRLLAAALLERIGELASVTHLAPVVATNLAVEDGGAVVTCARTGSDETTIKADLVIAADGRQSKLRELSGITTRGWQYGQDAIVCTIAHSRPHHGLALEHFLPGGPFAVLPMVDDGEGRHRSAVVWTEKPRRADAFIDMPQAGFEAALVKRSGGYLGQATLLSKRFRYPLGLIHAQRYTADRLALAGEAAHGIHPIAGQGLNLSLRDIAALTELIVNVARLGGDVGTPAVLRPYARRRRLDNVAMAAVTDGLDRLFSTGLAPVQLVRDLGLDVVGRIGPLKRFFMRQAMGEAGRLPALVRGKAI